MSSSSQDLEFLDLSGVCDEDRQHLLSLFSLENSAVELPISDVLDNENYEIEEDVQAASSIPPPVPSPPSQVLVESSQEEEEQTLQSENAPVEEVPPTEYASPVSYIPEGSYDDKVISNDMTGEGPPESSSPSPSVPSISITTTTIATTTTSTTSVPMSSSSNSNTSSAEVLTLREFTVPPPTIQGQSQVHGLQGDVQGTIQHAGQHQAPPVPPQHQVGPQVYQPYPSSSPGNPPIYNPNMPPPPHPQPPSTSVYSQMPPPPPPVLPHGATVYVANCHVNLSPYSGTQTQVPVLAASNAAGGTQSPPPPQPPPNVMQPIPIMTEPTAAVHIAPMKAIHDKPEFENRRFEQFRGHRGRGRPRGRGRRVNTERSNSVSSDHSGYGGEKHYPDGMGPPQYGPIPGTYMYPNVQYQVRGGYAPYPNVPAHQHVQGMPLMYQHQYPHYLPYQPHGQGHLVPYQQPAPGPHPTTLQPIHHQPPPPHHQPSHHPQPHPHHYQHHPEPPPPPQHIHQQQQHPHHYQVVTNQEEPPQPQPVQEQPNFPPETSAEIIDSSVEPESNVPPYVSSQYESNSSVAVIPGTVVNVNPSVTAAPETDRISPLTTQAAAMTLEDSEVYSPETSVAIQQSPPTTVAEVAVPAVSVVESASPNPVSGIVSSAAPPPPPPPLETPINEDNSHAIVSPSIVTKAVGNPPIVSNSPQVVLPQIIKPKKEHKPVVDFSMEATTISDITFMSDEIQLNVDPQEAVEFISLPKPAVITTQAYSQPTSGQIHNKESTLTETISTVDDNINNSTISSENVSLPIITDNDVAATTTPVIAPTAASTAEISKKENVPEMVGMPNIQPGGAWAQKKVWSQLFKPCDEGISTKQVAYVAPFNQDAEKDIEDSTKDLPKVQPPISEADIDKAKMGAMLRQYVQDHHHVAIQPRGLINKGYWCYVNAPLQALLACPPFYNLMKNIPNVVGLKKGKSTTPVIDSIVEYVHEFTEMGNVLKMTKKEKSAQGRIEPEVVAGSPFEPSYVYKMLANVGGDRFTEGRQQDAEEMLSVILNGLHDEMVEALKLAGGVASPVPENSINGSLNGDTVISEQEEISDDDDEWQVMGPRKRSCITRTAHITPSPISGVFWGQLRSILHQSGVTTANLQPFTTLPLDIQSPKVENVRDALEQLVGREEIPDFTCSKTNQEVTVCKQVLLETLPTILILQLKRFIYDKDGGLQKVVKKVNFPIDLEITKELMSPNSRGKFTSTQRKYKLLAVVYHDGKEATKGHYIADIYHSGYNCWLRFDDSVVKAVSEANVLKHVSPRVPYLLFYRRGDTLVGSTKAKP